MPDTITTYDDLLAVVRLMEGFPAPWYVSGGWALDCFLGRVTREHEDIEIGLARQDQGLLHGQMDGWQLLQIVPVGEAYEVVDWPQGERLELPIHQIVVRQAGAKPPEFQFFLNEVWEGRWHFRRDQSIQRPFAESHLRTASGIPVIAPEIQLLYKAKTNRPKDEQDFQAVLPHLGPKRRRWLRHAIARHQPGHRWAEELRGGNPEGAAP